MEQFTDPEVRGRGARGGPAGAPRPLLRRLVCCVCLIERQHRTPCHSELACARGAGLPRGMCAPKPCRCLARGRFLGSRLCRCNPGQRNSQGRIFVHGGVCIMHQSMTVLLCLQRHMSTVDKLQACLHSRTCWGGNTAWLYRLRKRTWMRARATGARPSPRTGVLYSPATPTTTSGWGSRSLGARSGAAGSACAAWVTGTSCDKSCPCRWLPCSCLACCHLHPHLVFETHQIIAGADKSTDGLEDNMVEVWSVLDGCGGQVRLL